MPQGTDPVRRPDAPTPPAGGREAPSAERDHLFALVEQVERWAELGLHARGFAHDLGNLLTAASGHVEIALLDHDVPSLRAGLVRVQANLERVIQRLKAFKEFVAHADERPPVTSLRAALDEAVRFVAFPLRKAAPWPDVVDGRPAPPWIEIEIEADADATVAISAPRLIQALVAALESFLRGAQTLHGALHVRVSRLGERALVEVTLPAGAAPREDDLGTTGATGFEIEIARRSLAEVGGVIEEQDAPRAVRICLPLTAEGAPASRPSDPDPDPDPASDRARRGRTWRESPDTWTPHGSPRDTGGPGR